MRITGEPTLLFCRIHRAAREAEEAARILEAHRRAGGLPPGATRGPEEVRGGPRDIGAGRPGVLHAPRRPAAGGRVEVDGKGGVLRREEEPVRAVQMESGPQEIPAGEEGGRIAAARRARGDSKGRTGATLCQTR